MKTVKGYNIKIDDGIKDFLDINKISGNLEQNSTEGYQLFDVDGKLSGSTAIQRYNNGFILNKSSNRVLSIILPNELPAGTYTLSYDLVNAVGTITSSLTASFQNTAGASMASQAMNGKDKITITATGNFYRIYFYIAQGEVDEATYTIDNVVLSVGEDRKTFEPYTNGISPNPEFKQNIKTIGQDINLFDNKMPTTTSTYSKVEVIPTGIKVIATNDGVNRQAIYKIMNVENLVGETFTVKCDWLSSSTHRGALYIGLCDEDGGNRINTQSVQLDEQEIKNVKIVYTIPEITSVSKFLCLNFRISKTDYEVIKDEYAEFTNIKLQRGSKPTEYSPYGMGTVNVNISNKNSFDINKWKTVKITTSAGATINVTDNYIELINNDGNDHYTLSGGRGSGLMITDDEKNFVFKVKPKTKYTVSFDIDGTPSSTKDAHSCYFTLIDKNYKSIKTASLGGFEIPKIGHSFVITTDSNTKYVALRFGTGKFKDLVIRYSNIQLEENDVATSYIPHQHQLITLPLQKEICKIENPIDASIDTIENINGRWYEKHWVKKFIITGDEKINVSQSGTANWSFQIYVDLSTGNLQGSSYPIVCTHYPYKPVYSTNLNNGMSSQASGLRLRWGQEDTVANYKNWLKEQYDKGTPLTVYAQLVEPELLEFTPEQMAILEQKTYTYEGTTHIYNLDELDSELEVSYQVEEDIAQDFDFYISKNNHLVVPDLDIDYLINIRNSEIPQMPEATENTIQIAGKDGDIVLSTVYQPINFNIICYTDDNLTPDEKLLEESKMQRFMNSMKTSTKKYLDLKRKKFYDVKYNRDLTITEYPKHLQFTVPFKTSNPYGKHYVPKFIIGNGEEISNTIEDTGAIITILGPTKNPTIISLNNYEIIYDSFILAGDRIVIDTNNSTITEINSNGTKSNAMIYYNHQFPKIINGINEVKVQSGINNENQVSVEWYDLKI